VDSLIRASGSRGGFDEATLDRLDAISVSEGDADGLVKLVLRTTLELLPCEHALLLLQTDKGALRLYTALDDGAVIGMPFAESGTILSDACEAGLPVILDRVAERNDAGDILARMFRARQLALAPLRASGSTLGLVGAIDPGSGSFEDTDLTTLMLIAARAGTAFDATRRMRKLKAEIADSEFLLQKLYLADENKTELLSVVSHEVKGPVTNIIGFSRALREEWSSLPAEKRDHFLTVITKEGKRAARLVEDVLDLARLESGSLSCDLQPVYLGEVVDEVLAADQALCESHDVVVELDPDLPQVSADPDRAGQVIRNLLANACSYSPQGSRVVIRATRIRNEDGLSVLASVTDSGPGIAESEQPELFDKFKRLSSAEGAAKGSGLGLFISRGIVEAHGGRIWVKSRLGEGTTFFFTLRPA
jgi:signal transduction histidine kinase